MIEFIKRIRAAKNEKTTNTASRFQFSRAIDFAQDAIHYEKEKRNQILILDYLITVIKRDLQAECTAAIFYCEDQASREIDTQFPYTYFDEHLISHNTQTEERILIDLSKGFYIAVPWNRQGMLHKIKTIFYDDFETSANQGAFYYPYIDLCYVYNGLHSTTCGI